MAADHILILSVYGAFKSIIIKMLRNCKLECDTCSREDELGRCGLQVQYARTGRRIWVKNKIEWVSFVTYSLPAS